MGKTLEEQIAELQRPNQTYNMWAVAGAAIPSAVLGVDAFIKNRKAKTDLKKQQGYVDTLMKNYMESASHSKEDRNKNRSKKDIQKNKDVVPCYFGKIKLNS